MNGDNEAKGLRPLTPAGALRALDPAEPPAVWPGLRAQTPSPHSWDLKYPNIHSAAHLHIVE